MLNTQDIFDDKRQMYGVSGTSSKFTLDIIRSINSVIDDLNFWATLNLTHVSDLGEEINISTAYQNIVNDGIDYYLTTRFEWTSQRKGDIYSLYMAGLKRSGTISVGPDSATGRNTVTSTSAGEETL